MDPFSVEVIVTRGIGEKDGLIHLVIAMIQGKGKCAGKEKRKKEERGFVRTCDCFRMGEGGGF